MKVKTWLMISYLVIMLLPVIFTYLFYNWIQSYYEKQAFHDFLKVEVMLSKLDQDLQQPALYMNTDRYLDQLDELADKNVGIALFSASGNILYSHPSDKWRNRRVDKSELYQDFYRLQTGLRAHTIKKPVFFEDKLIGVYEISMMRVENIEKLEAKRDMIIALLFLTFIVIYIVMIYFVNRKLIQPIKQLMTQMDLLGSGEKIDKLKPRKDEIGDLIKHFETMKTMLSESQQRIEQTQNEKEYMIASISHDLKTPLTSIRAYSESVLHNHLTEQEKKDYLEIIVDKVDFMKQMFDDLTIYTLLQNNDRPVEKVVVESEELFEMLYSGYEEVCSQRNIHLTADIRTTGILEVNINQLTRVVDNLFSNALKHTSTTNNIWLGAFSEEMKLPDWIFPPFIESIEKTRHGMMMIVQNEGKGIDFHEQEKILQPLYQVEASRTKKDQGTGLGLSIVKMIIEKHGGSIRVYSKDGYGTSVVCCLPYFLKGDRENDKLY
ncbi:ATP-binding protein [Bacillus sp. CGMCC 1.16607]|uniref:sensor histidine kinase n=1 Tax=Bacillus sp. CGMCC 1.16607 TaxID=3351842 RepID=UPI00363C3E8B